MHASRQKSSLEGAGRCIDRRVFVSSAALLAGTAALNAALPSRAQAKAAKRKRYAIVYKLNGGKQRAGQVKSIEGGKFLPTSRLKKPSRRGYAFDGWYANARLSKRAVYVSGKPRKGARTVFAKWKPRRYRISYKLNGGKAPAKLPSSYTVESRRIVLRAPTRKGHEFTGWYADSKFRKAKPAIEHGSVGDVELYARWQRVKYSITYDLNGGKRSVALPKSYTVASSDIRPIAPVRAGHRFAGWYTDAKLRKKIRYIPSGSVGDLQLHAKWALADYWDEHLAKKCARVNEIASRMANPVPSFVFITDMHLPTNAMVSPELVRKVVSATDTNMVVFGGDAINTPVAKSQAMSMLRYVRRAFGNVETHLVRGNHDGNEQGTSHGKAKITDAEFIEIARHESEVRPSGRVYCYRDDKQNKVRYIFLDSGEPNFACMDARQVSWLKKRVTACKSGWTVIVFVHQFFTQLVKENNVRRPVYDPNGVLVKAALDSVFDTTRASIAGVITGHCHKDFVEYSKKGYPIVSTACDAYARGTFNKDFEYKLGTLKEQAFDIVSLDTARRKLYFTRVGAGKNRVVDYPAPAVQTSGTGQSLADSQSGDAALQAAGG